MRHVIGTQIRWTQCLIFGCLLTTSGWSEEAPQFNRDIRPILSNNCFQCHGPDRNHRKADLRLDEQEGIELAFGPDGLDASEAWSRITADDPDVRMPPPDSHKELTEKERDLLRRWIETGATWQGHWSFVAPTRPAVPQTSHVAWVHNPIDAFLAARMEAHQLQPTADADRQRWLRRVTFDLTGLPPTLEEIDAFLADRHPNADETVVDRLLQSSHFGERMALAWMDVARYGDTSVYHADGPRDMWAWRDWVIRAYNSNLPFDQFTVDQLAGDLLPNATQDQLVAAGFNRNHGTTDEGGAIDEEYRVEYIVDRVKTTSTVWMGLTMECAQCHDHKYDPISQDDYYRFFAYFNQSQDKGMQTRSGNAAPIVKVFDPVNQLRQRPLKTQLAALQAQWDAHVAAIGPSFERWHAEACQQLQNEPAPPTDMLAHFKLDESEGKDAANASDEARVGKVSGNAMWVAGRIDRAFRCDAKSYLNLGDLGNFRRTDAFSYGAWVYADNPITGALLARMDDANAHRGYDLFTSDGHVSAHIIHRWPADALKVTTKNKLQEGQWHHVFVTYDGSSRASGIRIYIDGQEQELAVDADTLRNTIQTSKPLFAGRRNPGSPFTGLVDDIRVFARQLDAAEVQALAGFNPIRTLLEIPADQLTAAQTEQLKQHYVRHHDEAAQKLQGQISELQKRIDQLSEPVTSVMTMSDLEKPRMTYVLNRGSYDAPIQDRAVQPGTPAALPLMPPDAPSNRLGLARWIVAPNHPLTARVAVNRYWTMFFGSGIVRTIGDFGSQGDWPSHPKLLDWLAVEFVDSGWNIKHIIRMIVTSAAYRQSSRSTPQMRAADPENRWLARGPRFRLQGEFIRDNALAASGMLVRRIGGPSTKPYQPDGLWNEVSLSGNVRFVQDHGEALYRRSMYIYWKRSAPMPVLTIFDAPTREKCVMQRSRTNTPLQALVTLNDPQFVEAARAMAQRAIREGGTSVESQITYAYRLATGCRPKPSTLNNLTDAFQDELKVFAGSPERANKLLSIGESARDNSIPAAQHAALTIVMSLILNLDETLTRG